MIEEKNQNKKKFKLNILGDKFTVTGEFSEEYIHKLGMLIPNFPLDGYHI